jgi:DNA-binding CsgD family transcriptional regulator
MAEMDRECWQMNLDEKSSHKLVGAIYDGVADPALWQHALVQLSDATHSVCAFLIARDRVDPKQSQCVLARADPDLNQLFLTRYAKNPWTRVADRTLAGSVYATDAALPERELIKTEFYAEILRPQQVLHEGAAILAREVSRLVCLSVFRGPKVGPVGSKDLRLLSLVAPHFKRAAQIAWRLGKLSAIDAAKTFALDGLDHGVLLVDRRGHVLFANRAAEAIIALRDGLIVVSEGLRAALPADAARLQTLIADALRGAVGGTMRVTRPSLAEPFLLLVAPAHGKWHWSIDPTPGAVIFITALEQAVAPDLRVLAPAFDLTATEAKIALSIAAGGGMPATARALRISPNTVHTHLGRIFRKLGVNDQAALVRVLMRAVAVLAANDRDASQAAGASAKPPHEA